jgi:hypothetical protein
MSSYYDKYGGAPAYASVGANVSGSTFQEGIHSSVPSMNQNIIPKKVPNFKTLFEKSELHNTLEHRARIALFSYNTMPEKFKSPYAIYDPYFEIEKSVNYYLNTREAVRNEGNVIRSPLFNEIDEPFDPKKIELETVVKDGIEYLAPTLEFVDYLKDKDLSFVANMQVYLNSEKHVDYFKYKHLTDSNYYKYTGYNKAYTQIDNLKDEVNQKFKTFVADMSRSLIRLNKPFYADVGGDYHLPVSVGNFSAYELENFVDSIFGDVTEEDFVNEANEEVYNAKTPTTCCLKVCYSPTLYRKDDVPYEESKQYTQDQEEWQKWINSDEYTPYVPPPPQTEITLEQYSQYLNEAQSFVRSPLSYLFDKLKPYLEKGLIYLKNNDYIDDYKINGNDIYIENDLRNLF